MSLAWLMRIKKIGDGQDHDFEDQLNSDLDGTIPYGDDQDPEEQADRILSENDGLPGPHLWTQEDD